MEDLSQPETHAELLISRQTTKILGFMAQLYQNPFPKTITKAEYIPF